MRTIASVESRAQLIKELEDRSWGYCKDLSDKTIWVMKNMPVTSLVMTVRAVEDPANHNYPTIYDYDGVDYQTATEITEAVKDAKFLFIESRDSYFVRAFLTKLLGETVNPEITEKYGTIGEYESRQQFSEARITKFSRILNGLLTTREYRVLCLRLGLLTKKICSFKECAEMSGCTEAEARELYDLAIAKVWGNKKALKLHGYSWSERRKVLRRAKNARIRLTRLYINGGYLLQQS